MVLQSPVRRHVRADIEITLGTRAKKVSSILGCHGREVTSRQLRRTVLRTHLLSMTQRQQEQKRKTHLRNTNTRKK